MASLRIVSLNIESEKHLDCVEDFLTKEKPDVVCLQEVLEPHMERLGEASGAKAHFFAPMNKQEVDGALVQMGVAVFSRFGATFHKPHYYIGTMDDTPFITRVPSGDKDNRVFVLADIEHEGGMFRIGTTHFTWTPDGEASDGQRRDLQKLLTILAASGELVFAGDFNAPRGGEIFSSLSTHYKDNVPIVYDSSIDPTLHRRGHLKRMVDGIFSTHHYTVSNVRMVCGLSDHCALVGTVSSS